MNYNLYLFCDDESATLIEVPVLREVDPNMSAFTKDQLREVVEYFMHEYTDREAFNGMENWSADKLAQSMWGVHGLIFDSAAIVPAEKESEIKLIGETLAEQFGSDSSTYAACETFALVLKSHAIKVIKFPHVDFNLDYTDMV